MQQRGSDKRLTVVEGRKVLWFQWHPQPLAKPKVDPSLAQMPAIVRSAQVLGYSLQRFEYWLSPHGTLREWIRLNALVCVFLLTPATLIVPVVTFILVEVAAWTVAILTIVQNVAYTLGWIAIIAISLQALRGLIKRHQRR